MLLALALQAALPDAAAIADADFAQAAARCVDLYHVAPCPTERRHVTAIACQPAADAVACRWTEQAAASLPSDSCTATFVRQGGRWGYAAKPGAVSLPPSEAVQLPRCTATGSPTPDELATARRAAAARLSCALFPTDRWTCPAAAAAVEDVRCTRFDPRAPFDCRYAVTIGERRHLCHAALTRGVAGWTIITGTASDRRVFADESCQ